MTTSAAKPALTTPLNIHKSQAKLYAISLPPLEPIKKDISQQFISARFEDEYNDFERHWIEIFEE